VATPRRRASTPSKISDKNATTKQAASALGHGAYKLKSRTTGASRARNAVSRTGMLLINERLLQVSGI
jgi:hypothetical protein